MNTCIQATSGAGFKPAIDSVAQANLLAILGGTGGSPVDYSKGGAGCRACDSVLRPALGVDLKIFFSTLRR